MAVCLIAVDLEGVHGVVGEPNVGLLKTIPDYQKAVENATKEVNAVVAALADLGVEDIWVWDNHGGQKNLDFSKVDSRAKDVNPPRDALTRMDFIKERGIDKVFYIGYHAREGSLNGVLAHTYSSVDIQYIKVNGKQIGELEFDGWIAAEFGADSVFVASDEVCVGQVRDYDENVVRVTTKIGTGRNSAIFREPSMVLQEIYDGAKLSLQKEIHTKKLVFPCEVEMRFTRMEHTAVRYETMGKRLPQIHYGEDCHTLCATVNSIDELRVFLT